VARRSCIKLALVFFTITAVLVSTVFLTACIQKTQATDKKGVVVTILPQVEFVESVGGDKVAVTAMVPPGASPHTYEPSPSQMITLSKAAMYASVGSGVEFELAWMDKLVAVNDEILLVDCSEGIELLEINNEHAVIDNNHRHGSADPHIWMSPNNTAIMVRNICNGLIEVDASNKYYYEKNCRVYLNKLIELDMEIKNSLVNAQNRTFMVYHPFLGYFARDYNLNMLLVEKEGKEPTAAGIAYLIEKAKENDIKVIFASPQYNPESAEVIANAIGGKLVFIDPLSKDYITNLRVLVAHLAKAME